MEQDARERIRADWSQLRDRIQRAAAEAKLSQAAWLELSARYRLLSPESRGVVNALLAEWVLSDDPGLRSDAVYVIDDHGIVSAVPELRAQLRKLEGSTDPGARFEREELQELIEKLDQAA